MKKSLVFIILAFTVISCRINGNFKGLYNDNTKLKNIYSQLDCKNASQNTYLITGIQLRNCIMTNNERALVYIWGLHCKSDNCVNIDFFVRFCREKNIVPYIVIEYLTEDDIQYYKSLGVNLYVIDNSFYKTRFVDSYIKKFTYDLIQRESLIEERYFFFDENKNIFSSRTIDTFYSK